MGAEDLWPQQRVLKEQRDTGVLQGQSERQRGMGMREARARPCRSLVCILRAAGKDRISIGLLQTCTEGAPSQKVGCRDIPSPHVGSSLQEDVANLLTIPGLRLRAKSALLMENNSNERDRGEEGRKIMLGKKQNKTKKHPVIYIKSAASA